MLGPFHSAYLAGGMRGGAFLPLGFGDSHQRWARVREASSRRTAPALIEELRSQNHGHPVSIRRDGHLAQLERGGAALVITGQQVGLFLGPLYTLFKAASAIVIARTLTAETGVPCIPLFWLQTEDQDFAEIAGCQVPRPRAEPRTLSLKEDPTRERCSLADRGLGPEIEALLEQLDEELTGLPRASEVLDLLRRHYRPGVAPGRAFAGVLAAIFAEEGLLTYDPRQPVGARLAAPLLRTSLAECARLETALQERSQALEAAGFQIQIPIRKATSLAFFHTGDAQGPRHRLERTPQGYTLPSGEVVPLADLLALLERDPLRFSTSALLRPCVQDTLFPTAVYVGGPAEVDYFAQLPPLYAALGMPPPLIALRARFRLVPPRIRALLQRLELTGADLDRPLEELSARKAPVEAAPGPAWLAEVEQRLDAYAKTLPPHDRAWSRSVQRTRQSMRRAVERLGARHVRERRLGEDTREARLTEVARWLRPGGAPQERVYCFPAFAARVGLAELRNSILAAITPFESVVREISL